MLEEDARLDRLKEGKLSGRRIIDRMGSRLRAMVLMEIIDFDVTNGGLCCFDHFATEKFTILIQKHTALMDHLRTMSKLGTRERFTVDLFSHALMSYEQDGYVSCNALWNFVENYFPASAVVGHPDTRIATTAAATNKKRVSRGKAASKARRASRKK
jgi:hypothetical protein